jgi:integrase/recombinase XerD
MELNPELILVKPKREPVEETDEIKEWLTKFKEEREFDGRKPETIKNDLTRLRVFLNFCYNRLKKSPDKLSTSDFVAFFNYLDKERKVSKNTQKRYFDLLKVFYRLMRMYPVIRDFVEESKERRRFAGIEIKHYDPVDDNTINLILEKIIRSQSRTKIRDALIIRFCYDTGCRISEAVNIKMKDADLQNGIFKLRNTKGKVERIVVCAEDTLEFLRQYVKFNVNQGDDAYLFQNYEGGKVRREWVSEVFRRAVRELKEEGKIPKNQKIVLHSTRGGRCVNLLDKGVPLEVVKEVLGHKSIKTTLHYANAKKRAEILLKDIKKLL